MPKSEVTYHSDYTPKQIYDLVVDVDKYQEFLPWCAASKITERFNSCILAELVISYKSFTEKYTSKIDLSSCIPEADSYLVEVEMVEGPFRYLKNIWRIEPDEEGAKVYFMIDFKFKSKLLELLIGSFFKESFKKMQSAFEDRAKKIYK